MSSFKAIPEKEPVKWPAVLEPSQVGKHPKGHPHTPDKSNSCRPVCCGERPHRIRATSMHFELNVSRPIPEKAFNLVCFEPIKAAVCKRGPRLLPRARPCTGIVDSDSPLTSTSWRVNLLKLVERPERTQTKFAISAKAGLDWENILHDQPNRPQPTGPDSPAGHPCTIERKVVRDCLKMQLSQTAISMPCLICNVVPHCQQLTSSSALTTRGSVAWSASSVKSPNNSMKTWISSSCPTPILPSAPHHHRNLRLKSLPRHDQQKNAATTVPSSNCANFCLHTKTLLTAS